jgi:hypothetical protein
MSDKINIDNVSDFYDYVMRNTNFGYKDFPISFNIIDKGEKKLLLVIGDNAEGKSLITSQMLSYAHKNSDINGYNIGMQARTRGGIERSFVYANENVCSTGFSTVLSVTGGIRNCVSHSKDSHHQMMLVLDEPTLGLSDRYERPMGEYIANTIKENKELDNFKGIILVTHSKELVRSLINNDVFPTVVYVGDNFKSLNEWLNTSEHATLEELLGIYDKGNAKKRSVKDFFKKYNN